jgi:hypothetical protein
MERWRAVRVIAARWSGINHVIMNSIKRANISLVIGIACVVSGLAIYVRAFHLHTVYYYNDTVLGAVSSLGRSLGLSGGSANRAPQSRQLHLYEKNARGFIHSGRFLFFRVPADTTLAGVARDTIGNTMFYTLDRYREALRTVNGLADGRVAAGTVLLVPAPLPPYVRDPRNTRMPPIARTVGIYYSGHTVARETIFPLIDKYRGVGINTIVFDVKDITGIVNYRSTVPLVVKYDTHDKAPIGNIDYLVRFLKDRNIYTVARIALFRDHLLNKRARELAIRTHDGRPWEADSNELWVDPTNRHVQEYCIALAEELADKGVDEIQFDYIRFPTHGSLGRAALAHHFGTMSTEDAITDFLKRAHARIAAKNARLSIDIFGIVAWGKDVDIRKTGQRIELLAKHCDVISPMLYPSHFNNDFEGFSRPGDNPYYFIFNGCKKVAGLAGGTVIRPWLQAFRWRVSSYNEQYIADQVKASDDAGALGYLFWNASNNYETVYRALAGNVKGVVSLAPARDRREMRRAENEPARKKSQPGPRVPAAEKSVPD